MRDGATAVLLVLGALLVVACRPDAATPRGAAERFLDAHYVRIDLPTARDLASGLARSKVEDEIRLVDGQQIDDSTRKPTIHYKLLEEHPDGDAAVNLLYRADITVEDADPFERRWLVTVRREDGVWRVANYQELGG
jgi:hypothetical protein